MFATLLLLSIGAKAAVVLPRACTYSVAAQVGSTCASIASDWGISLNDFKSWNPTVKDCSKLTTGTSYCVEWSGALPGQTSTTTKATSSPTTTPKTTPPPTTTKKQTTTTTTSKAPSGPSPTQEKVIKTCNKWHKVVKDEICQTVADKEKISLQQLYQWNPDVGTDCKGLWLDYYVCVGVSGGSSKPTSTTTTSKKQTTTTTTAPPAIQTQPGVVSNCRKFHEVGKGEGCWAVEDRYKISHENFRKWNPMLDDTCSNMWLGYFVCVGV